LCAGGHFGFRPAESEISLTLRERVRESTAVPLSTPKTKLTSTPNSGGLITDKRSALPRTRPAQIAQVPSVPLRTEWDLRQQVFKEHLKQCRIVLARQQYARDKAYIPLKDFKLI